MVDQTQLFIPGTSTWSEDEPFMLPVAGRRERHVTGGAAWDVQCRWRSQQCSDVTKPWALVKRWPALQTLWKAMFSQKLPGEESRQKTQGLSPSWDGNMWHDYPVFLSYQTTWWLFLWEVHSIQSQNHTRTKYYSYGYYIIILLYWSQYKGVWFELVIPMTIFNSSVTYSSVCNAQK